MLKGNLWRPATLALLNSRLPARQLVADSAINSPATTATSQLSAATLVELAKRRAAKEMDKAKMATHAAHRAFAHNITLKMKYRWLTSKKASKR